MCAPQQLCSIECSNDSESVLHANFTIKMPVSNKLCGINRNSSSVLSQGESVKYFLDNLDKLGDPVSSFCPAPLVIIRRVHAKGNIAPCLDK